MKRPCRSSVNSISYAYIKTYTFTYTYIKENDEIHDVH